MKKDFTIAIFLFCLSFVSAAVSPVKAGEKSWKTIEECKSNFKMEDLTPLEIEEAKKAPISNYYVCKALSSYNINECDKLGEGELSKLCKEAFYKFKFFTELALTGNISSELMTNPKMGRDFIKAFNAKDDKFCDSSDRPQECRAFFHLNEKESSDLYTKDIIFFMKALRNADPRDCNRISGNRGNFSISPEICKALVTRDPTICNECQGVKEFRDNYCNSTGRSDKKLYKEGANK